MLRCHASNSVPQCRVGTVLGQIGFSVHNDKRTMWTSPFSTRNFSPSLSVRVGYSRCVAAIRSSIKSSSTERSRNKRNRKSSSSSKTSGPDTTRRSAAGSRLEKVPSIVNVPSVVSNVIVVRSASSGLAPTVRPLRRVPLKYSAGRPVW